MLIAVVVVGTRDAPEVSGPFGQHYPGLEQRRLQAGVSTMAEPADGKVHLHAKLAIFVDGKRVRVPPDIGIAPSRPRSQMAGIHTHRADGTIHVEGAGGATLDQFFRIWGVPFSRTQLGPHRARASRVVQMWVDGKPSQIFGRLRLADGQRITVSIGVRTARDPTS